MLPPVRAVLPLVRARALSTAARSTAAAPAIFDANEAVWSSPYLAALALPLQRFATKSAGEDKERPRERLRSAVSVAPVTAALPFIGAASATEAAMAGPKLTWWLSECVNIGGIKMGLPGLAAQTFFFSPVPVVMKIAKDRDVGNLPLLPYSAMCVNGFVWGTYGILLDNSAIWAPNASAFVMGAVYTGIFYKHCGANANWLPGTRNMHVAGIAVHLAAIAGATQLLPTDVVVNYLGLYGCGVAVVMFSGPLASMKQVIADKSTASLPFGMTVATVITASLWTVFGKAVLDDVYIWGPNALGLLSGVVQLGLFSKYGFAKPAPKDEK